MSKQKALSRLSEVVTKIGQLQQESHKLDAKRRDVIQQVDAPFSAEQTILSQESDRITEEYYKAQADVDDKLVKLNKKREKARNEVRKPLDKEIRKTTNEIDRLMNEAKDLADEYDVVVHFDDGTSYDPSGDGSYHDSWESSSC